MCQQPLTIELSTMLQVHFLRQQSCWRIRLFFFINKYFNLWIMHIVFRYAIYHLQLFHQYYIRILHRKLFSIHCNFGKCYTFSCVGLLVLTHYRSCQFHQSKIAELSSVRHSLWGACVGIRALTQLFFSALAFTWQSAAQNFGFADWSGDLFGKKRSIIWWLDFRTRRWLLQVAYLADLLAELKHFEHVDARTRQVCAWSCWTVVRFQSQAGTVEAESWARENSIISNSDTLTDSWNISIQWCTSISQISSPVSTAIFQTAKYNSSVG